MRTIVFEIITLGKVAQVYKNQETEEEQIAAFKLSLQAGRIKYWIKGNSVYVQTKLNMTEPSR
jgi:hypothetical protein